MPPSYIDGKTLAGYHIDEYYNEQSMISEYEMAQLKLVTPLGVDILMEYYSDIDSDNFCNSVFGVVKGATEEKITITKNAEVKLKKIRREAYQTEIDTIIAACNAASEGNVDTLRVLWKKGVNLNYGDYDNRSPLHVSCGGGHYEAVKFLLEEAGVIVSPVDRWGATPLNDADPHPRIRDLLLSRGAWKGKI